MAGCGRGWGRGRGRGRGRRKASDDGWGDEVSIYEIKNLIALYRIRLITSARELELNVNLNLTRTLFYFLYFRFRRDDQYK